MKRTYAFGAMFALALASSAAGVGARQSTTSLGGTEQGRDVVVTGCLIPGSPAGSGTGTSGVTDTTAVTGTSGTTGSVTAGSTASGSNGSFILVNANLTPADSSSSTTGTAGSTAAITGTSGSTTAGSTVGGDAAETGRSFILAGGQPSELQRYVNSRVEVRGTLDKTARSGAYDSGSSMSGTASTTGSGSAATSSTGSGSTSSTGSTASSGGMIGGTADVSKIQRLRVTSVRQVAGSCTGGQQ